MPRECTTPLATIHFSSIHSILNRPRSVINCLNTTKPLRRGWSISTRADEVSLTTVRLLSSYPYSEEHNEARLYLRARCPAWCDRILLNHSFKTHVNVEVRCLPLVHLDNDRDAFRQSRPSTTSSAKTSAWVIIRFGRSSQRSAADRFVPSLIEL